jgi:hypothetical protein
VTSEKEVVKREAGSNVDDTLLWSPKLQRIEQAIQSLQATGMSLEVEDSVAGFLGVHIERNQ